jgi:hypothetical protein
MVLHLGTSGERERKRERERGSPSSPSARDSRVEFVVARQLRSDLSPFGVLKAEGNHLPGALRPHCYRPNWGRRRGEGGISLQRMEDPETLRTDKFCCARPIWLKIVARSRLAPSR